MANTKRVLKFWKSCKNSRQTSDSRNDINPNLNVMFALKMFIFWGVISQKRKSELCKKSLSDFCREFTSYMYKVIHTLIYSTYSDMTFLTVTTFFNGMSGFQKICSFIRRFATFFWRNKPFFSEPWTESLVLIPNIIVETLQTPTVHNHITKSKGLQSCNVL